ncbi:hypothetical protein HQ560_10155, partial [bacterium]|nr:hypothetical protein [bacterium]
QRRLRFILMAVPPLIVLSTAVVAQTLRRWPGRRGVVGAWVVVVAACGVVAPSSVSRLVAFRQDMGSREESHVRMQAGRWMAEEFDPSSKVLADYYAYVPKAFDDMSFTGGGKLSLLEKKNPDLVVVTDKISERYADPERGKDSRDGEKDYLEVHEYYRALAAGEAGYALSRDFGEVQVYRRKQ